MAVAFGPSNGSVKATYEISAEALQLDPVAAIEQKNGQILTDKEAALIKGFLAAEGRKADTYGITRACLEQAAFLCRLPNSSVRSLGEEYCALATTLQEAGSAVRYLEVANSAAPFVDHQVVAGIRIVRALNQMGYAGLALHALSYLGPAIELTNQTSNRG